MGDRRSSYLYPFAPTRLGPRTSVEVINITFFENGSLTNHALNTEGRNERGEYGKSGDY